MTRYNGPLMINQDNYKILIENGCRTLEFHPHPGYQDFRETGDIVIVQSGEYPFESVDAKVTNIHKEDGIIIFCVELLTHEYLWRDSYIRFLAEAGNPDPLEGKPVPLLVV